MIPKNRLPPPIKTFFDHQNSSSVMLAENHYAREWAIVKLVGAAFWMMQYELKLISVFDGQKMIDQVSTPSSPPSPTFSVSVVG
jgi:hypothetical protein